MTSEQGLEESVQELLRQCCEPFCRRSYINGEWQRVFRGDENYEYVKEFKKSGKVTDGYCPRCFEDSMREVNLQEKAQIRNMEPEDAAVLGSLDKRIHGDGSFYSEEHFKGVLRMGGIGYIIVVSDDITGYVLGIDPKLVDYKAEESESRGFPALETWGVSPDLLELFRKPGAYELLNISVVPEEQRNGYGSWLLRDFMRTVCTKGYTDLYADEKFDGDFNRLAKKFGFEKIGEVYMPDDPNLVPPGLKPGQPYADSLVLKLVD